MLKDLHPSLAMEGNCWICCQSSILNHLNAAEKPHFYCKAWGFRDGEKGSGSLGFLLGLQDLEGMKKFSKFVNNS